MAEKQGLTEEQKAELIKQLRDIKGFVAIQIPQWIVITLIVIVVILLGVLIYYKFIKKRQQRSLTLYEITIEKLKNFDYGSSSKKFYLDYSELVRNYIEQRLQLAVMDKTAEEIKPILISNPKMQTHNAVTLSKIFARADLAKFARKEFDIEVRSEDIELTISILNNIEELIKAEEERRLQAELQAVEFNKLKKITKQKSNKETLV